MRRLRSLLPAILALAVLAGQWLSAVHDPDHGLQPGAAQNCSVCVYAHGAGAGALPALPELALEIAADPPVAHCALRPLAAALCHHPIRGPPDFLA